MRENWIKGRDYPEWADNEEFFKMIPDYLQYGETPRDAYLRVARTSAEELGKPELAEKFFNYIWKNWLCLASPVLANSGTNRGLPISCFGIHPQDDTIDIADKLKEFMVMSKYGGGVGINFSEIRGEGEPITGMGTSDGTRSFVKLFDTATERMRQGKVRKSASSCNLDVNHKDFFTTFIEMRGVAGDIALQIQKMHHCAVLDDKFMEAVAEKKPEETNKFLRILKYRIEKAEPFILFKDNVNKANPPMYKDRKFEVSMTNICSEIALYTDKDHSFVCCLSSLNVGRYDEWKDTELIYYATMFLDGIMSEFIRKAKTISNKYNGNSGLENSLRFAEKSRALGLGILGWHSYLISKDIPYISPEADELVHEVFGNLKEESKRASMDMAEEYGEPEWCKGYGVRNTHTLAIAPTLSNSMLSGQFSPNKQPYESVYWNEVSAKGSMVRKNPYFVKLLQDLGKDTYETWSAIKDAEGSVEGLDFLTDHQKEVYKSFIEIDQLELVKQTALMQQYVDQAISLNIKLPLEVSAKRMYEIHLEGWKRGIKTFYYLKSKSSVKANSMKSNLVNKKQVVQACAIGDDDCQACDG